MTEPTDPAFAYLPPFAQPVPPASTRQYVWFRKTPAIFWATGSAAALLCAGYATGYATASSASTNASTDSGCVEVTKERAALADRLKSTLTQQFRTSNVSTQLALQSRAAPDLINAAHITVNNPSCFTPSDVAENQQVLSIAGQ